MQWIRCFVCRPAQGTDNRAKTNGRPTKFGGNKTFRFGWKIFEKYYTVCNWKILLLIPAVLYFQLAIAGAKRKIESVLADEQNSAALQAYYHILEPTHYAHGHADLFSFLRRFVVWKLSALSFFLLLFRSLLFFLSNKSHFFIDLKCTNRAIAGIFIQKKPTSTRRLKKLVKKGLWLSAALLVG